MPPTIGPTDIGSRGPMPDAILPEAGREDEHDQGDRGRRQPGLERRVAGDLLEEEADEEEAADQAGVGDQRGQVGDREVADPEEAEVEHRVPVARLAEDEEREAGDAGDQRHPDHRVAPAVGRLLDQGEDGPAEADRREQRSRASRCRGTASGSRLSSTAARAMHIVSAISGMLTQKIARQETARSARRRRPGRSRSRSRSRRSRCRPPCRAPRPRRWRRRSPASPGTSSAPAIPCRARAAIRNSLFGAMRAEDRGDAEADQADDEHPPPPELVAERAADQEQRDQGQHVGLDHPLLAGQAGVRARR